MQKWIREYKPLRYVLAGSVATLANLGTSFVCVEFLGMWYILGASAGFCAGVVTSYLLQKFWVFEDKDKNQIRKQFAKFTSFAILMLGLNTLFVYFMVDVLGLWYLLSQAISSGLVAVINYNVFNKIIFKNNLSTTG